jgi:hypothetical protein
VLDIGRFVATAPKTGDYGFELIHHQSLRRETQDWLMCSSRFGAADPWVRRPGGREWLNSRTYTRWMGWNARWGLTWLRGMRHVEAVMPIWACPIRAAQPGHHFMLYPLVPGVRDVNFGFWDVIEREFGAACGMDTYAAVKARYDPGGGLVASYEKGVERA